MIWAVLAFVIVAVTKYLTSMRLRALSERAKADERAAAELSEKLGQATDKEAMLEAQAESLSTKVTAVTNLVQNLERSLNRGTSLPEIDAVQR